MLVIYLSRHAPFGTHAVLALHLSRQGRERRSSECGWKGRGSRRGGVADEGAFRRAQLELLAAARSLELEMMVDMKAASLWSLEWRVRRSFKWYVFNDVLLVCRPNKLDEGFHKKLDALVYAENKRLYDSLALMLRGQNAAALLSLCDPRACEETKQKLV